MTDQIEARLSPVRMTARTRAEPPGLDFDRAPAAPAARTARTAVTGGNLGYGPATVLIAASVR